jgi:hypothetical protein
MGLPPEMDSERRSPFSSIGANTKAMRKGTGDISKMHMKYPRIPKTIMVRISKTLLLME